MALLAALPGIRDRFLAPHCPFAGVSPPGFRAGQRITMLGFYRAAPPPEAVLMHTLAYFWWQFTDPKLQTLPRTMFEIAHQPREGNPYCSGTTS